MSKSDKIVIYMTASSKDEAEIISKALVEARLVVCANIFQPHRSVYWWEGALQSAEEVAVIFKTTADKFGAVEVNIKELHSYDVPCIVSWSIEQGHGPFLEWIEAEASV